LLMVCTVLLLMVCTVMLMRSLCNKGQARRPSSESQTDKKHPARLRAGLLHANDCVENERPRRSSLRSDRSPGASDRARTGDLLSSDERLRKSGSRSDRRLGARGGVSDGVLSSDERLGASGLRSARRPDQTRTAEKIGGGRRARGAALLGIMVKAVAEEHAAEKELGLEANEQGEGLPPAAAAERDASIGTLELSRDDDEEIVVFVPKGGRPAPGPHLEANNGMSTETLDVRQVVVDVGKGMSLSQSQHAIRNRERRRRRNSRNFVKTRSRDECAERFGLGWWEAQSEEGGLSAVRGARLQTRSSFFHKVKTSVRSPAAAGFEPLPSTARTVRFQAETHRERDAAKRQRAPVSPQAAASPPSLPRRDIWTGQPTQPSKGADSEPRVPGGKSPIFRGIDSYFLERDVIATEERDRPCVILGEDRIVLQEDRIVLRAAAPARGRHAARTPSESWHGQIFVRLNQGVSAKVLDACHVIPLKNTHSCAPVTNIGTVIALENMHSYSCARTAASRLQHADSE
jgi:hypothetical protein